MAYIGRTPTNAALTASDLADGIVSTAKIAADAVTDAKIADDVVGTEHLTANEVDTAALGADAVTGAQLADNAINSEHYTDGSIDTAHIAADQITNAKIADDQIDSEHYVDGSIDTAHIADNQITLAKLAGGTDGNIISYDASGDPVAIATGSDGQVLTSTGAGSPPAFEALPSSGSHVKLLTTTVSGSDVSAITFDSNYITSTYDNYVAVCQMIPGTDNATPIVQIAVSGAFQGGANDYGHGYYGDGGTDGNDNDRANIEIGGSTGNATGENCAMHVYMYGLTTTTHNAKFAFNSNRDTNGGVHGLSVGGGSVNFNNAINGVRFLFGNGNVKVGSKVTLYGVVQ